jgi:predicted CoA-binding protein
MKKLPASVAEFLEGERLAVAGVSRDSKQAANAIYRRLLSSGFEVLPVNPRAEEVEGVRCFPDVLSLPDSVHGLVVATPPAASAQIVREAGERGIGHIWFHRSFGSGSVSEEAVRACEGLGMHCIVGGCPMMFCEPVDIAHKCMRWWLQRKGRVPK